MFIEYENELDNSNRIFKIFKEYENYIGDNKNKNDILDKVSGGNVKDTGSEKDAIFKNNSYNRFIKVLNNDKRELQSNKQLLLKNVSIIFY